MFLNTVFQLEVIRVLITSMFLIFALVILAIMMVFDSDDIG